MMLCHWWLDDFIPESGTASTSPGDQQAGLAIGFVRHLGDLKPDDMLVTSDLIDITICKIYPPCGVFVNFLAVLLTNLVNFPKIL